jgi:phosphate transport system substrate-binding protein
VNLKRFGVPAVIAVTAAIALSSCAANESGAAARESASSLSGNLVGAGASSQDAAQQAWIAGFQTANPDVTIDYDPSGSGAGRETFLEGASDFAGSTARSTTRRSPRAASRSARPTPTSSSCRCTSRRSP